MRSPTIRITAAALCVASLLNGLALVAVHHHGQQDTDRQSVQICPHGNHAHQTAKNGDLEHRSGASDPSQQPCNPEPSDDCEICQFIAQPSTLPQVTDFSPLPGLLDWTDASNADSPPPCAAADYDSRGPPA